MSSVDISIDLGARLGASMADFGMLAGEAREVLEGIENAWQSDMLNTWPVDTGTSQAAWENFFDGLVWVLRNPVEYSSFVQPGGGSDGGYTDLGDSAAYLEAQAETYAAQAITSLRRLLTLALRQRATAAPQMFGRRAGPSLTALLGDAVFGATVRAFQTRGARQRLRERFPNEPIGRASTRRRTRAR